VDDLPERGFSKRFGCPLPIYGQFKRRKNALHLPKMFNKAERFLSSDVTSWVLQKDNDPKHQSKLCTAWKLQNYVTMMN